MGIIVSEDFDSINFFIIKLILTIWQFLFIESKENIFIIIINIPYLLEVSKVAVTKKENGKKRN